MNIMEAMTDERRRNFWAKVDIRDFFSCWDWKGDFSTNGYGRFRFFNNGKRIGIKPHRISFTLFNSQEIPNGLIICHHCDNKKCCNPSHLFIGTHKDNSDDKIKKGRGTAYRYSMDWETLERLDNDRKNGMTKKELSAKYGISTTHMYRRLKPDGRQPSDPIRKSPAIQGTPQKTGGPDGVMTPARLSAAQKTKA
jgi:hypothetical protein